MSNHRIFLALALGIFTFPSASADTLQIEITATITEFFSASALGPNVEIGDTINGYMTIDTTVVPDTRTASNVQQTARYFDAIVDAQLSVGDWEFELLPESIAGQDANNQIAIQDGYRINNTFPNVDLVTVDIPWGPIGEFEYCEGWPISGSTWQLISTNGLANDLLPSLELSDFPPNVEAADYQNFLYWSVPVCNGGGYGNGYLEFRSVITEIKLGSSLYLFSGTPAEQVSYLIDALADLNLSNGTANSLDSKLYAALVKLEEVNQAKKAALNNLGAVLNQVEAQSGKNIDEEEADALIDAVSKILAGLLED